MAFHPPVEEGPPVLGSEHGDDHRDDDADPSEHSEGRNEERDDRPPVPFHGGFEIRAGPVDCDDAATEDPLAKGLAPFPFTTDVVHEENGCNDEGYQCGKY